MQDNSFPRSNRILKSKEFRHVFGKGRKLITATLVFHFVENEGNECRLGLAVSRKVGKAVTRNFVKRRIREAFRVNKTSFPGSFDIVVYPRRGVLDKSFDDYMTSFRILLGKCRKSAGDPKGRV